MSEKQHIIDDYKKKLHTIPCKYFDYGRGECPFGSSCFYAHLNTDGSKAVCQLRKVTGVGAETRIVAPLR
jgi:E3 ubiquitin-protein ligase makorin